MPKAIGKELIWPVCKEIRAGRQRPARIRLETTSFKPSIVVDLFWGSGQLA